MRNVHLRLECAYKAAFFAASLTALSGCADLKPMQAQIDDLRARLDQLQRETKAAATANTAAANASAASLQKAIRQMQLATQSNAKAVNALNDKIDQMFKRPLARQAVAEQQPLP
jgi:predicted nuclease with TOPRIM domain